VKENSFAAENKLLEALENRSMPSAGEEGHPLFKQGDIPRGVYIVKSGEVDLTMESSSGTSLTVFCAGPGSLLGLPAIVANQPYTLTAMAREGSTVRFVPRDDFESLIQAQPWLQFDVLQILAAEVRSARRALGETVG
jgi:CRP-like cAMP-binding protein